MTTTITIDEPTSERLRRRAAEHGRTPEDEAREILEAALTPPRKETGAEWVAALRAIVEPIGGIELEIPPREAGSRPPPTFE